MTKLQRFIPQTPDPFLRQSDQLGAVKFGHLNALVDAINATVYGDYLQLQGDGPMSTTLRALEDPVGNIAQLYLATDKTAISSSLKIGSITPNVDSAILQIDSTTKGVLFPRMTVDERNAIVSPAVGLLIYNTDDLIFNTWDGTEWTEIGGGGGLGLLDGALLSATLTAVVDKDNIESPLKLSTDLVSVGSTLQIATDDTTYIDAEDSLGSNRFTVSRLVGTQAVNIDFASNPTLSEKVGAIRTYQDGAILSDALSFEKNGQATFSERVKLEADSTVTTQTTAVIQATDTNSGIAIVPNGTGAITAQVPDDTAVGGNARGRRAVDLQYNRNNANQVASGPESFVAGALNTASGNQSFSTGYGNTSSGNWSFTHGAFNVASSSYATISGGQSNTVSINTHATVVGGANNVSSGQYSVSGGQGNTASAQSSVAFGYDNGVTGEGAVGLGYTNRNVSGFASVAIGGYNDSTANYSVAMGEGNASSARAASVLGGRLNNVSTDYSVISGGESNIASTNTHATVVGGKSNVSSGQYSVSGGNGNTASGKGAVTFGLNNTASGGLYSIAMGSGNNANNGVAMGSGAVANTFSTAFGYQAQATNSHAFAANYGALASGEEAVAFGNGSQATNTQAFAVNSSRAYGQRSFSQGELTEATSTNSSAFGKKSLTNLSEQLSVGRNITYSGDSQYSILTRNFSTGQVSSAGSYTFSSPDVIQFKNSGFGSGVEQIAFLSVNIVVSPEEFTGTVTGLTQHDVFTANYTLAVLFSPILAKNRIIGTPTLERSYSDASMSTTNVAFTINSTDGGLVITVTPPTWTGGGTLQWQGTSVLMASQLGMYN